jgi:hypothetical protein
MCRLMEHGTVLTERVKAPYMWLLNYHETNANKKASWADRSATWDELRAAKIETFPVELRDMIKASIRKL